MLPIVDDLISDFTVVTHPSRTYNIKFNGQPSFGQIDGLEAMKQAIFLMLNTERFVWEIYSWNYGIELADKIGADNTPLLQTNLSRVIADALIHDDRISAVDGFSFTHAGKGLTISFAVTTTVGDIDVLAEWGASNWEVKI